MENESLRSVLENLDVTALEQLLEATIVDKTVNKTN